MSVQKNFGVECKNQKCRTKISLGRYLTSPEYRGDWISFVVVTKAGAVKCPKCGESHEYGQADLREL